MRLSDWQSIAGFGRGVASLLTAGSVLAGVAGVAMAAQLPTDKVPALVAPRLSLPPKIDGAIEPVEWREAASFCGLAAQNPGTKLLIMRPTTFYLAWDADNLYLACRTWIMPGYKPHVAGRAPGAATAFDDGMEFNLKPMGKNVVPGRADSTYKFFLSCMGSDGDLARVSVGQLFRNWQPQFTSAYRLTAPGSAPLGGSWWECEARLPVREFELTGPNRAGDTWKMLLAFNHIPGWMQAAVPMNSAYFDPSGWPSVTLAENVPAVQVTMDAMPGPLDGVAAARFFIFNPGTQVVQVSVLAQFMDLKTEEPTPEAVATATDLVKKETVLNILGGKAAEFTVSEKFPTELGRNAGAIFFRVLQGERELYRYFTYFKTGYDKRWIEAAPATAAFPFSGTFNPARNNFELRADTYYLDKPESAKKVDYKVTRAGESKPVLAGSLDRTSHYFFSTLLQMPALAGGDYTVEAAMTLADGSTLGPVTTSFKKLDEAKVFASWWQNRIGDTERLVPPFTAVRQSGREVEVLGRRYTLAALGLPAQIESQDGDVLAAPARLIVTVSGKEVAVDLGGKVKFAPSLPWRCSFTGDAKGAGLAFSAVGNVEQDGLTTVTLTFAPAGKDPVKVDAMRLEFPLAAADAECLLCIGPGGNFSTLNHLVLPTDKPGRLWSTLDMGKGGSMMQAGTFYTNVWIGNERRGFLWWADSDAGWVQDDAVPAHEAVRDGKTVVLRNHLVGKPVELAAPRTLTFSYNATPFKPLPKGWRMCLHSEDGTFGGPHKSRTDPKTDQKIDGWNWLNPPSRDPNEWSALWAEYKPLTDAAVRAQQPFNPAKARNHQSGAPQVHTSLPLSGYGAQSSDSFTTGYFQPEWGRGNFNPTMCDFLVWLGSRAVSEGGLRTIYWDIFYVTLYADLQAGFGYELPDGRVQPTSHGANLRRFMQRMYAMMSDNGLAPGCQVAHSTNAYPLVAFPWIDAVLDGEWAEITDATDRDWVDFYPPERMRVMSVAQNFGVQVSWMSLFHLKDRERLASLQRGFLDYQRLHDSWTGQDGRFPPDAILEWGLNDARLEYVPYWRNRAVTSPDPELLVAAWRLPERVLLMVFNNNRAQAKAATVKLDLKALGLTAGDGVVARELGGGGDPDITLDPATGLLAIPGLAPHTARYVGLRVVNKKADSRLAQQLAGTGISVTGGAPPEWQDWGMVTADTKFLAAAPPAQLRAVDSEVRVSLWQLPDRVVLAVKNTGEQVKDAVLEVKLDKLGLAPQLPWQEFVRVKDFATGGPVPAPAVLDFHGGTLTVPKLAPGSVRFVGLRRY